MNRPNRIDPMQTMLLQCFVLACCLVSGLLSSTVVWVEYSCFESGEQGTAFAGDQSCYTQACGDEADACGPCEGDDCCEIDARPGQPADQPGSFASSDRSPTERHVSAAGAASGSDSTSLARAGRLREGPALEPAQAGFAGFLRPLRA